MTSKRILFHCGGSVVSGVEILTLALMKELRERGHQVHCLVSGWNDGDFIARLEAAAIGFNTLRLGFLYARKPLWTLDTLLHYPGAVWGYRRAVKRFGPGVEWHVSHRTVLMLSPFQDSRRTVLHVHDRDHPSRRMRFVYRILNRKVTRFVAVSRFIGGHLAGLGIPRDKIRVILNGIRVECGDRAPSNSRRAEEPARVGIVGQIIQRKGHEDLLNALAILKAKGHDFRCLVFGKGDLDFQARLRKQAAALGLDRMVDWKGFVADPADIYPQIDVAVVPTRDPEPFGLVALEPAFWRLPVVATRSGGLAEIVSDGETGLLCEAGEPADLAAKIGKLLVDSALRVSLGERARERAFGMFRLSRMADEIEELLDLLVAD